MARRHLDRSETRPLEQTREIKALRRDIESIAYPVTSVNGATGAVVLDADDIDDAATTNKFATAAELAKVGHLTVTQAVDLDAMETKLATVASGAEVNVNADWTSSSGDSQILNKPTLREVLSANRTYYVNASTGSDSNNGLGSGTAFATRQKAVDVVAMLDLSIYNVEIQLAGNFTDACAVNGPWVGSGTVTMVGAGSGSTTINRTSGNALTARGGAIIGIRACTLRTTTSGTCLYAETGAVINGGSDIVFGASASNHIYADFAGIITMASSYSITGAAAVHVRSQGFSNCTATGITVTLTGTPGFAVFAAADRLGAVNYFSNTYSGSATGTRYISNLNSLIFTNGAGATALPGGTAGSTATGGQYA